MIAPPWGGKLKKDEGWGVTMSPMVTTPSQEQGSGAGGRQNMEECVHVLLCGWATAMHMPWNMGQNQCRACV